VEVNNNFSANDCSKILLPCIVQLYYNDNFLDTIVNLLDFYSLNLWRILSGGLGWSSHTVKAKEVLETKGIFVSSLASNEAITTVQLEAMHFFDYESLHTYDALTHL